MTYEDFVLCQSYSGDLGHRGANSACVRVAEQLALDGPLWLAVQQHLYRGWGPLLGGPAEIGALATTLILVVFRGKDRRTRWLFALAAAAYALMLVSFFGLNNPVNMVAGTGYVSQRLAELLPTVGSWPCVRGIDVGRSSAALGRAHFIAAPAR